MYLFRALLYSFPQPYAVQYKLAVFLDSTDKKFMEIYYKLMGLIFTSVQIGD